MPIIKSNNLCNELVLDAITMPSTIAGTMELFKNGYITTREKGCDLYLVTKMPLLI